MVRGCAHARGGMGFLIRYERGCWRACVGWGKMRAEVGVLAHVRGGGIAQDRYDYTQRERVRGRWWKHVTMCTYGDAEETNSRIAYFYRSGK